MSDLSLTSREIALNLADRTQLPVASAVALKFANTIARWSDRSKQRQTLKGLTNHELRDIGIAPDQANIEANKRFWQQ